MPGFLQASRVARHVAVSLSLPAVSLSRSHTERLRGYTDVALVLILPLCCTLPLISLPAPPACPSAFPSPLGYPFSQARSLRPAVQLNSHTDDTAAHTGNTQAHTQQQQHIHRQHTAHRRQQHTRISATSVSVIDLTVHTAVHSDGSSGGIIRLCTIDKDGAKREYISNDDLPKFYRELCDMPCGNGVDAA